MIYYLSLTLQRLSIVDKECNINDDNRHLDRTA